MILKNNKSTLFLIIALLSVCLSQKVSLPIKSQNGTLLLPITYGTNKCQVDAIFDFNGQDGSTFVNKPEDTLKRCGATEIPFHGTRHFKAPFYFGNVQTQLLFSSPADPLGYGKTKLTFGMYVSRDPENLITELSNQQLISTKKAFIGLNKSPIQSEFNNVIGQLDIGMSDQAYSVASFTEIDTFEPFRMITNKEVTFFGQKIDDTYDLQLNVNSPYTMVKPEVKRKILGVLSKNGIEFTQDGDKIFLLSIQKLQPIYFPLVNYNSSSLYTIQLLPSQYTRKLENGTYELMIQESSGFFIGSTIFESYYVGYDFVTGRLLIAENKHSNGEAKNFRRQYN